jgi:hypothetical protein
VLATAVGNLLAGDIHRNVKRTMCRTIASRTVAIDFSVYNALHQSAPLKGSHLMAMIAN